MDLILPVVSVTTGPEWATELDAALTTIDSHDHSTGKGAPLSGASITISANFSMNGFRLTNVKAVTFSGAPTSIANCLYSNSGVPMFNDDSAVSNQLLKSTTTSFTTGDLLYASGSTQFTRLAIGSSGQTLKVSGGLPSWSSSSITYSVVTETNTDYTIQSSDDVVQISTGNSNRTINLPIAASNPGKPLYIEKIDTGTGTAIITGTGGNTVNFAATVILPCKGSSLVIISDGSNNWDVFSIRKPPTQQAFTTGSAATYTTPVGCLYLTVEACGGGGGGGGGGTANTSTGGGGGTTTFGTSLITCVGGGGAVANGVSSGTIGTATIGSGAYGIAVSGGIANGGGNAGTAGIFMPGGGGGNNPLAGAGSGAALNSAGGSARANTGGGGGGGGHGSPGASTYSGAGGNAGGYIRAVIPSPATTYTYTVGAKGGGGGAGTNGSAGGDGADGYILVTEYYQ